MFEGTNELVAENNPLRIGNSLTLYLCGWEECAPGHAFGPAIRPHYLFHYILRGKGIFQAGGRQYALHAGQGFLICPQESTYYAADETEPWQYCWFGFDGYEAEAILARCELSEQNRIFHDTTAGVLEQALIQLVETFDSPHYNDYAAIGQLYLVFSHMARHAHPCPQPGKGYADAAADFIGNNYSYDIKIGDIARHIGIDRTYLYKAFLLRYQCSPQQYLIRYRLDMACRLLESTDASITEIACSCGFKDTPSFYKRFCQRYAQPPAQYRRNFRT